MELLLAGKTLVSRRLVVVSYTRNLGWPSTGENFVRATLWNQSDLAAASRSMDFQSPLIIPARISAGVFFNFVC
jgi:hypothetical protein